VRIVKRLFWVALAAGLVVVVATDVEPASVFAPLLGYAILRIGLGSLASLRAGADHVPDGPPEPVDTRAERTVYRCGGCGAEVLLLIRGAAVPPRHCGERMTEHHEIAHGEPPEHG